MRRRDLLLGTLVLLAAWQAVSWVISSGVLPLRSRAEFLPGPLQVFPVFFCELPRELGGHFVVSLWRVVASMLLAVALAVPAGLVMGQSRALNRLLSPLVYLTYPVPKVVLVPVVVLFFGVGDLGKIVVITLMLFFQILVLVRDAAAGLRAELHPIGALAGGRPAGAVLLRVPARQPAGDADGAARVGGDGGGGAVRGRAVCHPKGPGLLHLPPGQHVASITRRCTPASWPWRCWGWGCTSRWTGWSIGCAHGSSPA